MYSGARIVTIVVLVALFNELCFATINIFDRSYEDRIVFAKLKRRLIDSKNQPPEEIHRILAHSRDKNREVVPGFTIERLLWPAEVDLRTPRDCYRERAEETKKMCHELKRANHWLSEYCKYCHDTLINHCKTFDSQKLFEHAIKGYPKAISFSKQLSDYIYDEGEEDDPLEKSIVDFMMHKLNDKQRKQFVAACQGIQSEVLTNICYFDEGAKRTKEQLRNNNPELCALKKRCKHVVKMHSTECPYV